MRLPVLFTRGVALYYWFCGWYLVVTASTDFDGNDWVFCRQFRNAMERSMVFFYTTEVKWSGSGCSTASTGWYSG